MAKTIPAMLHGVGNVGRGFLQILQEKGAELQRRYGVDFRIVCVADSSGAALNPAGYDPAQVLRLKQGGGRVRDLPGYQAERSVAELLTEIDCELLLEATPVNLQTGEPGLSAMLAALRRGMTVVSANKGPLALAFHDLHALAARHRARLGFSATVCGALPVINIGRRDLVAGRIDRLRGIFNATSNFILSEMATGRSYADALVEAQRRGIAETDPTLDVEGWDTANKLVIIANSFLGVRVTLQDVAIHGMTQITSEQLQAAGAEGKTMKLVATAQLEPAVDGQQTPSYRLTVEPMTLAKSDFLGSCDGFEMGIELHTDLYGVQYYKIWEDTALPTAAAMLRDAVMLVNWGF